MRRNIVQAIRVPGPHEKTSRVEGAKVGAPNGPPRTWRRDGLDQRDSDQNDRSDHRVGADPPLGEKTPAVRGPRRVTRTKPGSEHSYTDNTERGTFRCSCDPKMWHVARRGGTGCGQMGGGVDRAGVVAARLSQGRKRSGSRARNAIPAGHRGDERSRSTRRGSARPLQNENGWYERRRGHGQGGHLGQRGGYRLASRPVPRRLYVA